MPSTYSNLKIQLMSTGENNTTWGDVTNLNLGTAIEEAISGSADVTFASGDVTLTLTDTNASQTARNMRLNCIGTTGGAARNLIVPAIEKMYVVRNGCADAITIKNLTGTGITVPAGQTTMVFNDGTNVVDAVTALSSLSVAGVGSVGGNFTVSGTLTVSGQTALRGNVQFGATGASNIDSDTNTLYLRGTNVAWQDAGATTTRMYLNSAGNLGVGTTSPSQRLHVRQDQSGTTAALIQNRNATGSPVSAVQFISGAYDLSDNRYAMIASDGGPNTTLQFWTGQGATPVERMRIDSNGNVGIGTTSPIGAVGYSWLTLNGSSNGAATSWSTAGTENFRVQINNSLSAVYLNTISNWPMLFQTSNTERMRIDASGNVGIGTGSPLARLQASAGAAKNAPTLGSVANAPAFITNNDPSYGLAIGTSAVDGHVWLQGQRSDTTATPYNITLNEAGGNVGIGTTSPGIKVEISTSINDDGLLVGNTSTNGGRIRLSSTGTGGRNYHIASTANGSGAGGGKFVVFDNTASDAARLVIDSNGAVGIGTTSPTEKFHASTGTASSFGRFQGSVGNLYVGVNTSNDGELSTSTNNNLVFKTFGSERMRIDTSGNVGIGTTSPGALLDVRKDQAASTYARVSNLNTGASVGAIMQVVTGTANSFVNFAVVDAQYRSISNGSAVTTAYDDSDTHYFRTNAGSEKLVSSSTTLRPGADNAYSNGTGSFRWSVVYAATGTINTSDEREKEWRGGPTDAEMKAASAIIKEMGFYQWKHALTEKGADGARYHFGVRAQQVWRIMAEHGLVDPITDGKPGKTPYAFMCWDEWPEIVETKVVKKGRKKVKEKVVVRAAGSRFGLRADELTMFLLTAMEARLARLEGGAL